MALRTRLVLTLLGLLALGIGLALGATAGALQDWRGDQNSNKVLTAAGRMLADELAVRGGDARLTDTVESGDLAKVWRQQATTGDIPSFFQLRRADGSVIQTVAVGNQPRLGEPLDADFRPGERSGGNPDGERIAGTSTDGAADGGAGGPGWLVRSAWLENGNILVIALRTGAADELFTRTTRVAIVSGLAALVAVGLLSWRLVNRGFKPLDDFARVAGEIGAGDLSQRLPAARPGTEVGRLGAALNAMLGQLEEAFAERERSEQRLRRFVADASHELRTPIATIRGHAELFRRGGAGRPEDHAKILRRVESEAERMGELVDELLLLARLDQGRPLDKQPVDLRELAADAVADALVTGPDRQIDLLPHDPSGPHVVVLGDRGRLRQVLGNLLSNVLQHTPAGTPASVAVRLESDRAVVEVTDQGPGLTEEQQSRVFERFYRADDSRSPHTGGAGLGLSIVAAVITAHNGTVSVHSTPRQGTTFRLNLPR